MSDAPDPAAPEASPAAGPGTEASVERSEVVIRRAPRFGAFLFVGAALGAIATLVATSAYEVDPAVGFLGTFGYLLIYGIPAGLLVGSLAALVADAASRRRARTVTAERDVVGEAADQEQESDQES